MSLHVLLCLLLLSCVDTLNTIPLLRTIIIRIKINNTILFINAFESNLNYIILILVLGFSKFSGALCARGVTGLDDLHSATNEFLGHFVDVVYQFKGDGEWCGVI